MSIQNENSKNRLESFLKENLNKPIILSIVIIIVFPLLYKIIKKFFGNNKINIKNNKIIDIEAEASLDNNYKKINNKAEESEKKKYKIKNLNKINDNNKIEKNIKKEKKNTSKLVTQKLYDFEVIQNKNNINKDKKRIFSFVKVRLFIFIFLLLGLLYLGKLFALLVLFMLLIFKICVEYIIVLNKMNKRMNLINQMKEVILNQMIYISTIRLDITEKISSENIKYLKNKIKTNVIKMANIFRFLNNIRLILFSRKIVNKIIQNEVRNNKNLYISQTNFLNDIIGFKYKDDVNKLKLYVSKLIVQIGDNILPQNLYNLTLDFLFYLKGFLNDSVHFVHSSDDITSNKQYYSIFCNKDKYKNNIENNNIIIEDSKNIIKPKIKIIKNGKKNDFQNLKSVKEIIIIILDEILIYNKDKNNLGISEEYKNDIKLEIFENALDNTIKLEKDIDNLVEIISNKGLESQLINEYKINDEEKETKINYLYSLHELENDSINNFKKIFINFFYTDENGNIINNNSRYILNNKKDKFKKKYNLIIEKLAFLEDIIKKIIVLSKFNNYKDFDVFQKLIKNAKTIKKNINNMKNWINTVDEKINEYYDLLLLSNAYEIKVKNYEEKLMKDENVLAFEKIFEDWKKLFDNNYIKELKINNGIDKNMISVDYKNKKVEYIRTSKLFNNYIDKKELSEINAKMMMENIDTIIKNVKIDIYDTDEEINYSSMNQLQD